MWHALQHPPDGCTCTTNGDPYPDHHADTDPHANAHANPDANPHTDTDPYTHRHADSVWCSGAK